jgi:hypothetical protein
MPPSPVQGSGGKRFPCIEASIGFTPTATRTTESAGAHLEAVDVVLAEQRVAALRRGGRRATQLRKIQPRVVLFLLIEIAEADAADAFQVEGLDQGIDPAVTRRRDSARSRASGRS